MSRLFLSSLGLMLSVAALLTIVFIGIAFDIVGTAVTAADERPFHAMAAKRVAGAKQSIRLIRNADRVANICNDMVGDICGTISGAVGAGIVFILVANRRSLNEPALNTAVIALVAAITVSGKAAGKGFALGKANQIMLFVGRIMAWVEKNLHITLFSVDTCNRRSGKSSRTKRERSTDGETPR